MNDMAMPYAAAWGAREVLLAFAMWSVMMAIMMTPAATPMVVTYHRLARRSSATATFVAGYLLVWSAFSVAATGLQGGLHAARLLAVDSLRVAPVLGGALLIVAGVWQLTPLREACLSKCRSPASFLMTEWRDGTSGALGMGVKHGLWCVACCWALMLVLFAAGIMNLVWIAAIALWVLLEKTLPEARWLSRAGGVLAIAWGVWLIVTRAPGAT